VKYPLEALLDACIAQLNNGADLEEILAAHPDVADELRPLLAAAAWALIDVPPPQHRAENKRRLMQSVAARRRVVESVDGYITELKAGVPIQELLYRAPAHLRPVIAAAWRMRTTEAPLPSPERIAEGKQRVIAVAAARRAARRRNRMPALERLGQSARHVFEGMLPAPSALRRARSAVAAVALTAAVAVGASGVTTAAAASLPGEPFYSVKRLGEAAQLVFTFDAGRRAELSLAFAARRMGEMRRLADHGDTVPVGLFDDWLSSQNHAWVEINRLPFDQRMLFAEMLLDATGVLGSGDLGAAVPSHALADAIARSNALADEVRGTFGDGQPQAAAPGTGRPLAVPRPLPQEEPARAPANDDDETAAEPPVAQAAPPASEPPAPSGPVGAPILQPSSDDATHGDGDADEEGDAGDDAAPVAGAAPTDEPTEPAGPPPFHAPPLGTVTPSPPPGEGTP
jgi:hypothetical protein